MQFIKASMAGIIEGTITVTFRAWKKPLAVPGGRHRIWGHLIEIDDVRVVPASSITDVDARRAGEINAAKVRARLGVEGKEPIYRIGFHYLGPDDRIGLRNSAEALTDDRRAEIQ